MSKLQISLMDCPCNLTNLSSKVCMRCCASIIVGKNEIRAQKWKIRANEKAGQQKHDEVSGQACYSKPVKKYTYSPLIIGVIKGISPIELDIQ